MRREHIERLGPLCPTCRATGRGARPLALGTVARAEGDDVLEGVLLCTEPLCMREHPIVDGIAIVVTDLASWSAHQLEAVMRRDDLTPFTESLLGDAAGPAAGFHAERSNLSSYGASHWGEVEHGFAALLDSALGELGPLGAGPALDLGCAVGRGTLELARRTGDLAVGVDLSFAMLRLAERVRREGRAAYPRRRVGMVFDREEISVADVPSQQMSFWCADVAALPFADAGFTCALSLNVVDCVSQPLGHLAELGRVLAPGAPAVLTTPYDWSPTATPVEQWLGGHSQRSEHGGSSAAELRRILSPDAAAGIDTGLVITGERDDVRWRIPANERSHVEYDVHLLRLRRKP